MKWLSSENWSEEKYASLADYKEAIDQVLYYEYYHPEDYADDQSEDTDKDKKAAGRWLAKILLILLFTLLFAGANIYIFVRKRIDAYLQNKKAQEKVAVSNNDVQPTKTNNKIYTGVEIMEKLDAILLKDEEGVHYLPIEKIQSVCEEIGTYNYMNKAYRERYSQPRYVVRTASGERFLITKQVYKKIIETCYNVVIECERNTGEY